MFELCIKLIKRKNDIGESIINSIISFSFSVLFGKDVWGRKGCSAYLFEEGKSFCWQEESSCLYQPHTFPLKFIVFIQELQFLLTYL